MRFSRFARAQTAFLLAGLAVAGTAAAERPAGPSALDARYHPDLTRAAGAAGVLVHYTTAPNNANSISAADAARVARTFQWALQAETRWGFPPPARDLGLGGDDRLDVYVAAGPGKRSFTQPDVVNWPVSAAIQLDPSDAKSWRQRFRYRGTIAHELFHAIQLQFMAGDPSPYIFEATAEWAAFRASADYRGTPPLFADIPEAPLDCPDTRCGTPGGGARGYGQWPFFEYLAERHGARAILEVFQRDGGLGWKQVGDLHYWEGGSHALEAIDALLRGKGSSLARTWNAFTIFNLNPHRYTLRVLNRLQDWRRPAKLLILGTETRRYPRTTFAIDHLAASYVSLITPGCNARAPALSGVLHVRVRLPAASEATPALRITFADRKPVIRMLRIANGAASLDVRGWRACNTARLALPNPSATADSAQYTVDISLTASADRVAPKALALPSRGRPGARVVLRYQVFDDSGKTSRLLRVYRGSRLLWSFRTRPLVSQDLESFAWRAPRTPGTLRFCVRATDPAGNVSGTSCAPVELL